ncbi:DUF6497 family protein [Pseudodonghicola flavimaris]|uniref:DUF6497 family protein n=1 Tax=Pseudodonghicola flavimaris TaxID=3050036 RepID=A0ABT7F0H4_9RHOB|nr:DUF6497 family protein [Pseudodonghicola flavimaris]MDK3018111.1 DUF6497 family protein [Pseudodonghicola flavimaris]
MIPPSGYRTARRGFRVAHAAPAGGARQQWWGRGCGFTQIVGLPAVSLLSSVLLTSAACAATSGAGTAIAVPSGQTVTLQEVLLDDAPGALWARFRFVAPQLGHIVQEASAGDIDDLCQRFVLPYLAEHDLAPARVVISLSDRALDFGTADPAAVQYFETYRPEKTRCVWEAF